MKKLLSVLTVIFVVATVVAVFATSVSAAFVPGADSFRPERIVIKKATAAIAIDASDTVDEGYGTKGIALQGKIGTTQASCTADLAWDENYIYILMVVSDPTKYVDIGGSFQSDSIEFYFDFDNNKSMYNIFSTPGLYAGQFRVQRTGKNSGGKIEVAVTGNSTEMEKLVKDSKVAVRELNGGYAVEIAFAHHNLALSPNVGFALQVNDGNPGLQGREAQLFTNPKADIQDHCYQYTTFLDTAVLDGFTPTTTRQRTPDNPASDDTQVVVSSSAASRVSSRATSSTAASSTATSSAATSSAATSTAVSTVTASNAASTDASTVESVADTEADANVSTPDDTNSGGGLPTAALIAIIAGGVAVLAGGAVAVILIIKKKK